MDAVWSELVSVGIPCWAGKIQGNLRILVLISHVGLAETQPESGSLRKFPQHLNREISGHNRINLPLIREWTSGFGTGSHRGPASADLKIRYKARTRSWSIARTRIAAVTIDCLCPAISLDSGRHSITASENQERRGSPFPQWREAVAVGG